MGVFLFIYLSWSRLHKVLYPDTLGIYLLPTSYQFIINNDDDITGRSSLQLAMLTDKPKGQHFLSDADHFLMT